MRLEDISDTGICILSFDNGGPGTYSQLLMIKKYMEILSEKLGISEEVVRPADHFDLMTGVGFGGLAAFTLGYLRMRVDQAIDALLITVSAVFPQEHEKTLDPEANTMKLRLAISNLLETWKMSADTSMYDQTLPPNRWLYMLQPQPTSTILASFVHTQPAERVSTRPSSMLYALLLLLHPFLRQSKSGLVCGKRALLEGLSE
ncbi:hypothetical protein M408DRAFT_294987 [Serendipita vermifera MAFF 305830]|uniref:PNPLA domain-containing protein n=1 Tax=Serendipita vermifera MAFF 305830 TaxID=933852 RepID=A0A0C3BFH6_SERVB|nr:hypothetical protein M408DRAFT_294987 [Serendipita vermifera MAFF 305830]